MSDTSGPTSATPFASYDPESRCWRTSEATSLWALTLSSLTLPTWGCLRDGELYELPTPERLTVEPASSSLFPTPTVMDMGSNYTPEEWEAWKAKQREAHRNGNGHGASLTQEAMSLLPTPRAQNGEERNQNIWERPADQPQNLENALARIGADTPPPSTVGSASSDDPHPHLPFPA